MRLLVVGSDRVDAGKTTFSTGLLDRIDGTGFKPRAGNDHWFDHDDVLGAVADGRLYGKDANRLAAASAADVTPEAINPIHRLWNPAPDGDTGIVGRGDRHFVVDRLRTPDGDEFVVNAAADAPPTVQERLPVEDATVVGSAAELNAVTRERYLPAFERLAGRIRDCERAVVESYGDVAVPVRDLSFDAVAAVEPGRACVFDGERFLRAHEVAGGSARGGRLEAAVGDVVELIDPTATVSLPPLADDARTDPAAVADAYEVAFDAVIAAALE